MSRLTRQLLRRIVSPASWLYYRFLFGRRSSIAALAGRWMDRLEAQSSRGDVPVGPRTWDEQYLAGHWSFLRDSSELARYGVLVAFCERLTPGRSVLDVGCGEGILRDLLRRGGYERYVGVDLSAVAIEQARRNADPRDRLQVADAESYATAETFDAVVLNECLYYFHDPLAQAERYLAMCSAPGALVVSMFESPRTRAILRVLEQRRPRLERLRIEGPKGAWMLAVFRRSEPAPAPAQP